MPKLKVYSIENRSTLMTSREEIGRLLDWDEEKRQSCNPDIYVIAPSKSAALLYLAEAGVGLYNTSQARISDGTDVQALLADEVFGLDGDIVVQRSAQNGRHIVRLRAEDDSDPTVVGKWRYDREADSATRWQLVIDPV